MSDPTPNDVPVVRMEWEDIQCGDRWETGDVHPAECSYVGSLLLQSESEVVIGSGYSWQDSEWGWRIAFPIGCVQQIRVLWRPGDEMTDSATSISRLE